MTRDIVHEPAAPVERIEGGLLTRRLSGRVRAAADGVEPYLFALLRFGDYAPEVADGYLRVGVWLEPCGSWCSYSVTDREMPARKRR